MIAGSDTMLSDDLRAAPGLDIWVVPEMAKKLGFDPTQLQKSLEDNYKSVGEGDSIEWGKPQWVKGDNRALRYRGNVLKREKMWFQLTSPVTTRKFLRYLYTGWQWRVLPATAGVEDCEEMVPVVKSLNDWTKENGYDEANHFIVTRYRDGDANIGAHYVRTSLDSNAFELQAMLLAQQVVFVHTGQTLLHQREVLDHGHQTWRRRSPVQT